MRVASLFTGAGGADLGFLLEGFNIVFANDIMPEAVETYKYNMKRITGSCDHVLHMDIAKVASNIIPDCDIIIGGPPCQSFSTGRTSALDKTQNCSGLSNLKQMQRVVADKQPKLFICENVAPVAKLVRTRFEFLFGWHANYTVHSFLLNTEDYQLPQKRKRMFYVGVRKDICKSCNGYSFSYPQKDHWNNYFTGWADLLDPDGRLGYENSTMRKRTTGKERVMPWEASYTILASEQPVIIEDFSAPVGLRKSEFNAIGIFPHRLTVRECARLQGFPDNYLFKGNVMKQYVQVGNAWPVTLSMAIAKEVKRCLSLNF